MAELTLNDVTEAEPRYVRVAGELRQHIREGRLVPGAQLPTLAEMRDRYGVSQPTLERAHSILEREGLIERKARRGVYVAHPKPKSQTGFLGFFGGAPGAPRDPYWSTLVDGVQEGAERAGRQLVLLPAEREAWFKVDGVLLVSGKLDELLLPKMPPFMDGVSLVYPSASLPSIVADDFSGGYAIGRHLIGLGHKRIGALGSWADVATERLNGLHAAMREAGIEVRPQWTYQIENRPVSGRERARLGMHDWLNAGFKKLGCTAVWVANDLIALGVMEALKEGGIRVPEDVSVVGFDGTEMGEVVTPALSSVKVPLRQIGNKGVETLLRVMKGEPVESLVKFPVEFLERDSTAVARKS